MKTEIHRLVLGFSNCYLIREQGVILVDAGAPNKASGFFKMLPTFAIQPEDISLIMVTHGHWDHIGSLYEVKRRASCRVAVNRREKDWVEQALRPIPPAINLWGKTFLRVMSKLTAALAKFPGTPVDLVLEDEKFSLEPFGIHGKVLYTPGHTSGSMSVLLDTGDAFVGDLAVNGLPLRIGPGASPYAEDISTVKNSWRLLLDSGAKRICPGHGKPFKADVLERLL